MQTCHANIIIYKMGTNKKAARTTLIKTGKETLTYLLNHKTISRGEQYGQYDFNSRQWSECSLSTASKKFLLFHVMIYVVLSLMAGRYTLDWINNLNSLL